MNLQLREDAKKIYEYAICENLPNEAVARAINEQIEKNAPNFVNKTGKMVLISIGKAAWEMAKTAHQILGDKIDSGVVVTKYAHIPKNAKCEMQNAKLDVPSLVGYLDSIELHEAGHPVVDFNSICATRRATETVKNLTERDTVLFLISGGGSALFEDVSCPLEKMQWLTEELLRCGANINEINAIRKHISNVKGGKLAELVYPARVFAIALSDVIGNDLSTIASGPACGDNTTVQECLEILNRYKIALDEEMLSLIKRETPKEITNAEHIICGSVTHLCQSAKKMAEKLGYQSTVVCDSITEKGWKMSELFLEQAEKNKSEGKSQAIIFGGEITVEVTGNGKGGRNQHLALMCAQWLRKMDNAAVFSVGSDGTDGPTDAAGGYADRDTYDEMIKKGISPEECLKNSDSYNGLRAADCLVFTGPTGTNVNDLYVLLIGKNK